MVEFTDIQAVNDLLDTVNETGVSYIASGSQIEPARATRLIVKKSGIINNEFGGHYEETTYTDEYHDIVGIPRILTNYYPIISVSELSVYNGSAYEVKTEGRNRNTNYYYVDNRSKARGFIKFWTTPPSYTDAIKLTYKAGYETIPNYVTECCTYMTAIDIAMSKAFREECKDQIRRWTFIVNTWQAKVEHLMGKIRDNRMSVNSLGRFKDNSVVQKLDNSVSEWE